MDFRGVHLWSILKLNFAGYTGSKNQVQNGLKMEFFKIHFSNIKCRSTGIRTFFPFLDNIPTSDEFGPPIQLILVTWSLKVRIKNELLIECFFPDHFNPVLILNWLKKIF